MINPLSWYYTLDKTQTIEFWVAFGTIALASVTVLAVVISLLQNRSEHNRFEQGYAPLLEVMPFNVQGNLFYVVQVANIGYGPALDARFTLRGTWLKNAYDDATAYSSSAKPELLKSEHLPFLVEMSASVVPLGAPAWGFDIRETDSRQEPIDKKTMAVEAASLTYFDRFGNPYATEYFDFVNRQYKWVRPKKFGGRTRRFQKGRESCQNQKSVS